MTATCIRMNHATWGEVKTHYILNWRARHDQYLPDSQSAPILYMNHCMLNGSCPKRNNHVCFQFVVSHQVT